MPKKETFDFRLPPVAHERLCLSSLLPQALSVLLSGQP